MVRISNSESKLWKKKIIIIRKLIFLWSGGVPCYMQLCDPVAACVALMAST